jgi:hypothetical protein
MTGGDSINMTTASSMTGNNIAPGLARLSENPKLFIASRVPDRSNNLAIPANKKIAVSADLQKSTKKFTSNSS